ncbi:hypothetical protein [Desulfurobacterium indicum]|uniref:Fibronectin type-III domain-containing protein n=1 Tax=Desulfurobacterium indicum TaxID=1914305 RepID=A0A1R1MMQ3_9BACT|nr:hypothetical protein [Desulfurobacterium indicum]OMH41000.1 hypothetical protein BLW93_02170 [Desulfurobacterium indicum]
MKHVLIIIGFLLLSSFSTCGRRGTPLPPRDFHPLPPDKVNFQQVVSAPLIYWNPPAKFVDGEAIPLKEIKKLSYIIDIDFGKKVFQTSKTFFKYKPLPVGTKVCFRVAAIYKTFKGDFSEPTCRIIKTSIKQPPVVKEIKAGDDSVKIKFGKLTYKTIEIFKSNGKNFNPIKPYKTISSTIFIDKNVINGKIYFYKARYANNELKGPFTKTFLVKPVDNIPPAPPENLILITDHICYLVWEPSTSKDVKYYKIFYNGKCIGQTTGLTFTIKNCLKGTYRIGAVDKAGNITLSKPAVRR